MMSGLTRNLKIGFGVSLSILIVSAIASYGSIENLIESAHQVEHSNAVIAKLEHTLSVMKDAETGQRGYLLTNDTDFLQPYNGAYAKALRGVGDFQNLTKNEPGQAKMADQIREILVKRLNILDTFIKKKKAGEPILAAELLTGKLAMDSLRVVINRSELIEKNLLNQRLSALNRYTSDTPFFLFIAALIAVVVTFYSYFRAVENLKERSRLYADLQLREHETANLNEELAATNQELASANEELEAANEEIHASNEQLATANQELAAMNEELNAANEQLIESQEDVRELNEKLGASNEELSATVEELFRSQENLKALNDELEARVGSRTAALTESESRFRVIMETMPQIAWVSSPDGEISFFNKQWYEFTGLTYEESIRWGWTSRIHPDDLPLAAQKYREILESGQEGEFENRKQRHDGVYRWHLARIQPVKDPGGEIQMWVGTATDIHELKTLQQQKDDFISIASHELKTPITSLKASLQLLDRLKDNPTAQAVPKLIFQANKSLGKLSVLVEDLLNVSKLNQGQLSLYKTNFNIYQLINDCCQYIRVENVYSITVTGDKDLEVFADSHRIEQVMVNLLNNAMKYAPQSKEIIIHIEKADEMARISVSDRGPGIEPVKVPHLFDRYFRVDSEGMQFSGLGLGLYISSEIIKRHDGQIGVDTEIGKGSTFWFTVPLAEETKKAPVIAAGQEA
jgi:two-component system CheB/CheR fusion protein